MPKRIHKPDSFLDMVGLIIFLFSFIIFLHWLIGENIIFYIFTIFLSFFGVMYLIKNILRLKEWNKFNSSKKEIVQGSVIDRKLITKDGGKGKTYTYYIKYAFEIPESDKIHTEMEEVKKDLYEKMTIGTPFRVEYANLDNSPLFWPDFRQ